VINAGVMPIAPINLLKVEEWDRQIDINIKGVLYGVAALLPHMQKQKSGHIINIASVFGIKIIGSGVLAPHYQNIRPCRYGLLRHEIRGTP
jgi:NADP-dependent 3-hydroxy acid dehydrogenase YdfG